MVASAPGTKYLPVPPTEWAARYPAGIVLPPLGETGTDLMERVLVPGRYLGRWHLSVSRLGWYLKRYPIAGNPEKARTRATSSVISPCCVWTGVLMVVLHFDAMLRNTVGGFLTHFARDGVASSGLPWANEVHFSIRTFGEHAYGDQRRGRSANHTSGEFRTLLPRSGKPRRFPVRSCRLRAVPSAFCATNG